MEWSLFCHLYLGIQCFESCTEGMQGEETSVAQEGRAEDFEQSSRHRGEPECNLYAIVG